MSSLQASIPPEWLLKQDADTIEFISGECEKLFEIDLNYKKNLLEANLKRIL
jgi:hypothetical protein